MKSATHSWGVVSFLRILLTALCPSQPAFSANRIAGNILKGYFYQMKRNGDKNENV